MCNYSTTHDSRPVTTSKKQSGNRLSMFPGGAVNCNVAQLVLICVWNCHCCLLDMARVHHGLTVQRGHEYLQGTTPLTRCTEASNAMAKTPELLVTYLCITPLALLLLKGILWIQKCWRAAALFVVGVHHGGLWIHALAGEAASGLVNGISLTERITLATSRKASECSQVTTPSQR